MKRPQIWHPSVNEVSVIRISIFPGFELQLSLNLKEKGNRLVFLEKTIQSFFFTYNTFKYMGL